MLVDGDSRGGHRLSESIVGVSGVIRTVSDVRAFYRGSPSGDPEFGVPSGHRFEKRAANVQIGHRFRFALPVTREDTHSRVVRCAVSLTRQVPQVTIDSK